MDIKRKISYVGTLCFALMIIHSGNIFSIQPDCIYISGARWLPSERKLICLDCQSLSYNEEASDRLMVFDVKSEKYMFRSFPNIQTLCDSSSLPYIESTKEIVLKTSDLSDGLLRCRIIGVNPFVENPEIRTLYKYNFNSFMKDFDARFLANIIVWNNLLLFNCNKSNDNFAAKHFILLSFNMEDKTFVPLHSKVRSPISQTQSGNVYFFTEEGLERLEEESQKVKTVLSAKKIISVVGKWEWEHCRKSVSISPNEHTAIINLYYDEDILKDSGKEFTIVSIFDLISGNCLKKVCDKEQEHGIFGGYVITPDSKRIFTYNVKNKAVDLYDTSLKKIGTLFENVEGIRGSAIFMPCGKEGFIRIKESKKETESTGKLPFDFLMYTWDGELLFKFKPSEQIKRADDELLADKAIPEDTSTVPQDNVVTEKKEDHAGEINYLLVDRKKNKTISEGKIIIHKEDISVKKSKSEGEEFFEKEVLIADPFSIGICIHKEKPEEMGGFGLYLKNKSIRSFSWDWFTIEKKGKATKLQGAGTIEFSVHISDGLVEINKITFTSDTTLRCYNFFQFDHSNPHWVCNIKKGSYIYWAPEKSE